MHQIGVWNVWWHQVWVVGRIWVFMGFGISTKWEFKMFGDIKCGVSQDDMDKYCLEIPLSDGKAFSQRIQNETSSIIICAGRCWNGSMLHIARKLSLIVWIWCSMFPTHLLFAVALRLILHIVILWTHENCKRLWCYLLYLLVWWQSS